eukprot:gene8396-biopygen8511
MESDATVHGGTEASRAKLEYIEEKGELFYCGALPCGWNDSPNIFAKVMKVLVECLRSPRSAVDQREVHKLESDGVELFANELEKAGERSISHTWATFWCWRGSNSWRHWLRKWSFCPGTVGKTGAHGFTYLSKDDGDYEHLDMDTEKYELIGPTVADQLSGRDEVLRECCRGELRDSSRTELAV